MNSKNENDDDDMIRNYMEGLFQQLSTSFTTTVEAPVDAATANSKLLYEWKENATTLLQLWWLV